MQSGYSRREIASVIIQVLEVLKSMHAQGRIHKSLDLESIFVEHVKDDGPVIKIADFGIAIPH